MCDSAAGWTKMVADAYDKLDDPPGHLGDLLNEPYHSKMIRNISEVLHRMYRNSKEYRRLHITAAGLKKLVHVDHDTFMCAIEE